MHYDIRLLQPGFTGPPESATSVYSMGFFFISTCTKEQYIFCNYNTFFEIIRGLPSF